MLQSKQRNYWASCGTFIHMSQEAQEFLKLINNVYSNWFTGNTCELQNKCPKGTQCIAGDILGTYTCKCTEGYMSSAGGPAIRPGTDEHCRSKYYLYSRNSPQRPTWGKHLWPICRGGRCVEVADVGRWPFHKTVKWFSAMLSNTEMVFHIRVNIEMVSWHLVSTKLHVN